MAEVEGGGGSSAVPPLGEEGAGGRGSDEGHDDSTAGPAEAATTQAPEIPVLDFQVGPVVVGSKLKWSGTVTTRYEPSFATAIQGDEGDPVEIVSAQDSEWWSVRNERSGKQGFMPASMITISEEVEGAMVAAGAAIARRSPHASAAQESTKMVFSKLKLGKAKVAKMVNSTSDLAATSADMAMAAARSSASAATSTASEAAHSINQINLHAAALDARAAVEEKKDERWLRAREEERRVWVEEVLPGWHHGQIRQRSKRVRKLIEKGLPQEVRPLAWTQVVGNELALTRDMFETELKASHDAAPTARVRAGRAMIETDLERTFSSMGGLFSDPDSSWKQSLRQVLEAFLHYRPELGYVQGMSFIAAVLLMHTDAGGGHAVGQADAFPAFCCLANLLRPQPERVLQTLLRLDGPKMEILFTFWENQFAESLPSLHAHFIEVGMMPQLYLVEWVFTLFAKSLPQEPVAWIWDQILLLGDQRIFQVALGILKLLESKFLAMGELDEISAVLKDLTGSPTLFEALLEGRGAVEEIKKKDRWLKLYEYSEKMKLKTSLWKQLLADLQVFEEEIEEQTQDSELLRLVMALEHLDVDEEEAAKIAMAMERGRRGAVLLDWGDQQRDVEEAVRTTPKKADHSHSLARSDDGSEEGIPTGGGVGKCDTSTDSAGTEGDVDSQPTDSPDTASSGGKFGVSSALKKLGMRGSGSASGSDSHSPVSAHPDSPSIPEAVPPSVSAGGVMRELTDEVRGALERCCANTVDRPPQEDTQMLQSLAHKASGGVMVPWVNDSLVQALDTCTTPVLIKTLQLLLNMMSQQSNNRDSFLSKIKAECTTSLERAALYEHVDPEHGEKPAAMVKTLATKVNAMLLGIS